MSSEGDNKIIKELRFLKELDAYFIIENGSIRECNRKSEELFEANKDSLIGKSPAELSPKYQQDGTLSLNSADSKIQEALSNKKSEFEWIHKRLDGTDFYAKINLIEISDDKKMIFANIRDITIEKNLELEIREKEKLIREFLNELSHEVRTPLNGIMGFTELLQDTNLDELQREYLNNIQISSEVLLTSIKNLIKTNKLLEGTRILDLNQSESKESYLEDNKEIRVMIAEDIDINMKLIKTYMKKLLKNVVIFEAKNGLEAIQIAKENIIDIIFMDIQMPECDGIKATYEIRKNENLLQRKVPIIALTANTFFDEDDKHRLSLMDDLLSKPISIKKVEEVLYKYLIREY